MPADVGALIGRLAEGVQNRSLLLDKYVFHKVWPEAIDERGRNIKWDDATRWSFVRLTEGGGALLQQESARLKQRAGGRNVDPENRERFLAQSEIAAALSNSSCEADDAGRIRAEHTRRFVSLFRESFADRAAVTVARLEGRLAINLADSLIQNAGISLDRLTGLPTIPGSAIKGAARHAALAEIKDLPEAEQKARFEIFRRVFGTADNDFGKRGQLRKFAAWLDGASRDQKGAVSFLPAHPIDEDTRLVVDLTNVHYPDYYRTGNPRDQSRERPRPNPFPVVEAGARFAFCQILNGIDSDSELLAAARAWLEAALTVHGIGAKTASGYGWFSLDHGYFARLDQEAAKAKAQAEAERAAEAKREAAEKAEIDRIASLSPEERAAEEIAALDEEQYALYAKDLAKRDAAEQIAFINSLTAPDRRDRWKRWKKKKPALADALRAIAEANHLPPLP